MTDMLGPSDRVRLAGQRDQLSKTGPNSGYTPPQGWREQVCFCGHDRTHHVEYRRQCGTCEASVIMVSKHDGHYFETPEHHAWKVARDAARSDPNHVCGPFATRLSCPGGRVSQVCTVCDTIKL